MSPSRTVPAGTLGTGHRAAKPLMGACVMHGPSHPCPRGKQMRSQINLPHSVGALRWGGHGVLGSHGLGVAVVALWAQMAQQTQS